MKSKEEVISLIDSVFKEYSESFKNSLTVLKVWPWTKEKVVIHEFNLVHRFLDAYQNQCKAGEVVPWMELPVYLEDKKLAHVDAFILDKTNKWAFFIEAKRLSHESQVESLKNDIDRIFKVIPILHEDEDRFKVIDWSEYKTYAIALADVWNHRGKWCKPYAEDWKNREVKKIVDGKEILLPLAESIDIKIDSPKGPKVDQYHLLAALIPA